MDSRNEGEKFSNHEEPEYEKKIDLEPLEPGMSLDSPKEEVEINEKEQREEQGEDCIPGGKCGCPGKK